MEMHQLRYFVSVARIGNFSRAAEQCHVAQPSLSQQIQKLEDELGERLFLRMGRQTRLTAAGETFLGRALRILEEVEAARRETREASGTVQGPITLGILPTIAPYLVPDAIARFLSLHPGVEIRILEETTDRLVKLLRACELDLAIATLPMDGSRLTIEELFEEELLLALPPAHPLTRRRRIALSDLAAERWIVMQDGHCLGDQVLRFCDQRDLQARVSFRSAQLETVQAVVKTGLGVSLIPAMAARPGAPGQPEYRSLTPPVPKRKIIAAWPNQRPPGRAAREFLAALRPSGTSARA